MFNRLKWNNNLIEQCQETFRFGLKSFCCQLLKLLYIFPIKNNRIIFESYSGKGYSCNPKYVHAAITSKYPGVFETIWAMDHPTPDLAGPVCLKKNRIKYCYYMLTSKVVVTNMGYNIFFPCRKNQLKINTWHGGGAYKKMGVDIASSKIEQLQFVQSGKK